MSCSAEASSVDHRLDSRLRLGSVHPTPGGTVDRDGFGLALDSDGRQGLECQLLLRALEDDLVAQDAFAGRLHEPGG